MGTAAAGHVEAPSGADVASRQTADIGERVLAFLLDGECYALPIARVSEIQQIVAFAEVCSGATAVVGMANLRGQVIPVVDMRRLVGLPQRGYALETPMIIAQAERGQIALVVDGVRDVFEIADSAVQAAPPLHPLSSSMVGVAPLGGRLAFVLDLDRLLGADVPGGRL